MPFIPHTEADVRTMLAAIGVDSIDQLFDEIPKHLLVEGLAGVPVQASEHEITRLMQARAASDALELNFAGAGAYEHHIPAAVWEITTRGEFYSAYTPYQAEASQGTLQLIYEYQTAMTRLTGLDVSNASLYDGASALAEAVLMAVRSRRQPTRRILVPRSVNPLYRKVLRAIIDTQAIEVVEVPFDRATGQVDQQALAGHPAGSFDALVIPQPNYFGVLEPVDTLVDLAHTSKALAIGLVNPLSLATLKAPGRWGGRGVDIACGDGQPLGVPLSSGGPYFGFLCCRKELVRQMPGRIVGRTVDLDGKRGFALTLQAREQHIRRAKATSNICTNQGLLVTAATIYMALLGPEGLRRVATASMQRVRELRTVLAERCGARPLFSAPVFHEVALVMAQDASTLIHKAAHARILAGVALGADYPELGDALLVCATETKVPADFDRLAQVLN